METYPLFGGHYLLFPCHVHTVLCKVHHFVRFYGVFYKRVCLLDSRGERKEGNGVHDGGVRGREMEVRGRSRTADGGGHTNQKTRLNMIYPTGT